MAKTNGPLLSLSAHGSIGKILTYSKRKSGQQTRKYNKPSPGGSPAQRAKRRITEFLVAHWQSLSANDKTLWNEEAKKNNFQGAGYHYFLSQAQGDLYEIHKLAAYWSLNIMTGEISKNEAGSWGDLTAKKGAATNLPHLESSMNNKFSNGINFDEDQQTMEAEFSEKLQPRTNDIYIECWYKREPNAHANILFQNIDSATKNGIRLFVTQSTLLADIANALTFKRTTATIALQNYAWNMLSVNYDRDGLSQIFLNGEEVGTPTDISTIQDDLTPTELRGIGQTIATPRGVVDEVCLYKRIFTKKEIQTRFNFAKKNTA